MPDTLRSTRNWPFLAGTRQKVRRICVAELPAGAREAMLLHPDEEYRPRLTSNGKLILTK